MHGKPVQALFPAGHFYSPVVDPAALETRRDELWPEHPTVLGIDFDDAAHLRVLGEYFPRYFGDYDYPEELPETPELEDFFTRNSQFSWLDCRALFVLLRAWRPRRVIEVGSGFSSLLIADVNRRWFDATIDVICIEPYPRPFLACGVAGITRLIERPVQAVMLAEFERLAAGDVLFIDSSHVAKTGSDVNFLYFEVLPRLAPGVIVHVHDIFLPADYPPAWVLDENRSWNEQYLLRAFLMFNPLWHIEFGSAYAFHRFPAQVRRALGHPRGLAYGGGSLWLRRLG